MGLKRVGPNLKIELSISNSSEVIELPAPGRYELEELIVMAVQGSVRPSRILSLGVRFRAQGFPYPKAETMDGHNKIFLQQMRAPDLAPQKKLPG